LYITLTQTPTGENKMKKEKTYTFKTRCGLKDVMAFDITTAQTIADARYGGGNIIQVKK